MFRLPSRNEKQGCHTKLASTFQPGQEERSIPRSAAFSNSRALK